MYWQEIHIEWGKGLVQKREAEARIKELEAETSKPFARTRYSADWCLPVFFSILRVIRCVAVQTSLACI
jgi:hypothetical protein